MKKRYIPSILIALCLLINACVGAAYAKYVSVKKAENVFTLSSEVIPDVKPEPYAAYSANTNTLYFLNDALIDEGKTIPGSDNDTATEVYTGILGSAEEDLEAQWSSYAGGIETVIFLGNIKPVNIAGWFYNCTSLTTIQGMTEHLETEKVVSMGSAFEGCTSLTTLDLSGFNTAFVTTYTSMFSGCSNLKTIYVSENFVFFNPTLEFEGTEKMFKDCNSLVGGNGTPFNGDKIDGTYARIDGGTEEPGYFTLKGEATVAAEPTCNCEIMCTELNEACEVCKTDITNCEGAEATAGEELTCTCETKCAELNESCEVCKTDIMNCKGAEAPTGEELTCTCKTRCTAVNDACEICKTDITNCKGAEATAGEEPTCSCETRCTAVNETCEVCKIDYTKCTITEDTTDNTSTVDKQDDTTGDENSPDEEQLGVISEETSTSSPSVTLTSSLKQSVQPSATPTPAVEPTPTVTPRRSATPTPLPTVTATSTPSPTVTATPTPAP